MNREESRKIFFFWRKDAKYIQKNIWKLKIESGNGK